MSTDSSKTFYLTVQTGDEVSEIFIMDSEFYRVATGIGKHVPFELKSGLYTVKVRAGCDTEEKLVALFNDESISFEPIEFSSPAPLEGTGKTHEFHIGNAESHSHLVHVTLGQGSQLYVFVRVWTEKVYSSMPTTPNRDPCTGLTLRNLKDQVIVDFASPDIGHYTTNWEAWSACNVELNPGTYLLCLETGNGETFSQAIVTSPSWQTQIFLIQRDYGKKEKDIRADLTNGSIFMSRIGQGFQATKTTPENFDEPNLRLTEMARQALMNNRQVITDEIRDSMLLNEFNNPMLGIYGAHLLLLNKKSDLSKLQDIVSNLRKLLVQPHPDIEAIALKLKLPSNYIFEAPPMLSLSWNYILEASVQKPEVVPENSLASQKAEHFYGSDLWLIWRHSQEQDDDNEALREQLKKLANAEAASIDTSNLPPDQGMTIAGNQDMATGDANVLSTPQLASNEIISYSNASENKLDDVQIKRMVQALGMPRAKLEAMLKSIDINQQNEDKIVALTKNVKLPKSAKARKKPHSKTKIISKRKK